MTNTKNTPVESIETHYPFRVLRSRLRVGSGGEGKFPGGEGIEREIEFLADATVSLMGERRRVAPWGLAGRRSRSLWGGPTQAWLRRLGATRGQIDIRRFSRRSPSGYDSWWGRLG